MVDKKKANAFYGIVGRARKLYVATLYGQSMRGLRINIEVKPDGMTHIGYEVGPIVPLCDSPPCHVIAYNFSADGKPETFLWGTRVCEACVAVAKKINADLDKPYDSSLSHHRKGVIGAKLGGIALGFQPGPLPYLRNRFYTGPTCEKCGRPTYRCICSKLLNK